jgi:plastocyanin
MKDISFQPATIQAKVGDIVTWTNADTVQHTATLDSDEACTTDTLDPNATGSLTFSVAGSYPFHCKIHSSMHGTIVVS